MAEDASAITLSRAGPAPDGGLMGNSNLTLTRLAGRPLGTPSPSVHRSPAADTLQLARLTGRSDEQQNRADDEYGGYDCVSDVHGAPFSLGSTLPRCGYDPAASFAACPARRRSPLSDLETERAWGAGHWRRSPVAPLCLMLAGICVGTMVGSSRLAHRQAAAWAKDEALEPQHIMMSPVGFNPFRRNVLIASNLHHYRARLNWLADNPIRLQGEPTPISEDPETAAAALATPSAWGRDTWTRFLCSRRKPKAATN